MFTRRKQSIAVPEVGAEAPEFNLPSAQGGQLKLSMRTVRGPVVVVFLRGTWSEEDVSYMSELAAKEDEINLSGASIVGVGVLEPDEAREFVRESGIKSYVLYDYVKVTTRQWGLLEKDKEHGEYARPAVYIVGSDHKVHTSWIGDRPPVEEVMAKITEITGLPKPPEEPEKSEEKAGDSDGAEKPKKMSAEERERIKAERRAARESGQSVKTPQNEQTPDKAAAESGEKPKKMSAEERERIKAERRAAREQGKSLKTGSAGAAATPEAPSEAPSGNEKPKKMSAEERERIKAERRAAREAGRSLKQPTEQGAAKAEDGNEDTSASADATEPNSGGSDEPDKAPGKPKEE